METRVKLAEETGGTSVVLTSGGPIVENSKLQKGILARGAAQMFGVTGEKLELVNSYATAYCLLLRLRKLMTSTWSFAAKNQVICMTNKVVTCVEVEVEVFEPGQPKSAGQIVDVAFVAQSGD